MATTDLSNQDCQSVVLLSARTNADVVTRRPEPAADPFFGVAGALAIVPCAVRVCSDTESTPLRPPC